MAKKELMGWVASMKRWQKRYRGKLYTVSPRQLGIEPRTREATRDAGNQWWEKKEKEIDEAAAPEIPDPGTIEPLLKVQFPLPPKIVELLQVPSELLDDEQRQVLIGWKQKVDGQTQPLIRKFIHHFRDKPTDMSVGYHVQRFVGRKLVEVDAGEITPGRYESYRCEIEPFGKWGGTETEGQSLTGALLEDYVVYLQKLVAKGTISAKTAAGRLSTAKQFIRALWEIELIELPRNIESRRMKITVKPPKKATVPLAELKKLIKTAEDRTRLYLLLMLNCGFTQTDIATLRHDEVDWKAGRIKRKRTKTKRHERVPEVDYLLWPDTLRLLRHHRSNHGELVLVNKRGQPLRAERIVDGRNKVKDAIKNAYWRLQQRTTTQYPLKLLRKTAASLLAANDVFARYGSSGKICNIV